MPAPGDLLLRGTFETGFTLVDATTGKVIAEHLPTLQAALDGARALDAECVWQQNVDARGRPIGQPYRLSPPSRSFVR